MTADDLTTQNSALWDVWLDKYVKRLTADMADVADVTSADRTRREIMNSTNPRYVYVTIATDLVTSPKGEFLWIAEAGLFFTNRSPFLFSNKQQQNTERVIISIAKI